jgi:hypothetical protein
MPASGLVLGTNPLESYSNRTRVQFVKYSTRGVNTRIVSIRLEWMRDTVRA